MVSSKLELLPGAMSGSMDLPQLWSVLSGLMFIAPVTTKSNKDRAAQSWSHPSMAAALERTGPVPHQLQHSDAGDLVPHRGDLGLPFICHIVEWEKEK